MTHEATLELEGVFMPSAGVGSRAPLRLRSEARSLGLLGNWESLFQALVGTGSLGPGSARVLGAPLESALAGGVVGFAPCDPPLPPNLRVSQYLEHAARLSHGSPAFAARDAQRALRRYGLTDLASQKLASLAPHQARALGIAQATLTSPPLVCLEEPLRGLTAPSADYVARLCAEAASEACLIVSAARPEAVGPERRLLEGCDELFQLEQGELVFSGPPRKLFLPGERYRLTVAGAPLAPFAAHLAESGCQIQTRGRTGHYVVLLPAGGNTDLLLDAALAHGLVVLELEPVLGTL